jgi:NAD-dependent SIR2 family protein deacetylase
MGEPNPQLVELLSGAERILVFTGAGISTGSGIADYRGP